MVLGLEPDLRVVGEAADGTMALEQARALKPDVVLLDIRMPRMSGIEVARSLKQVSPHSRVIILSGVDVDQEIMQALESDVDGYILKEAPSAELLHAIRVVAGGQAYLQPSIAKRLLRKLASGSKAPAPATDAVPTAPSLTGRELDVLRLMVTGHSNHEIAEMLTLGEETVRTHVKSILHKLGQPTRTQAVVAALKSGLIQLD
jgi:DNA-binding NarL/FixJ family response regulator